jgi:hypothetical protein
MNTGADRWGVPDTMFGGPIPDEFAAAIARVALLSALVESKLHGLLSTVGTAPQSTWAGRPAGAVLDELDQIARAGIPARRSAPPKLIHALRAEVAAARADAHTRNELLHAVWPLPLVDGGVGWKPLPPKQRENPAAWTRSVTGEFQPLITRLVNHVSTIETLRARTEELPRNQNPPTQ